MTDSRSTDMTEIIERLAEIRCEIAALIDEARERLRDTPEADRAKAYWLAHVRCALDDDHATLGGSMITLQDTIEALAGADIEADAGRRCLPPPPRPATPAGRSGRLRGATGATVGAHGRRSAATVAAPCPRRQE